jgi:hypothetical protein
MMFQATVTLVVNVSSLRDGDELVIVGITTVEHEYHHGPKACADCGTHLVAPDRCYSHRGHVALCDPCALIVRKRSTHPVDRIDCEV